MKITKLGHSCVLVETADKTGLFDPGVWSEVNVAALPQIDRLIITHKHADHMDVDFIKKLVEHSPQLNLVTNDEVAGELKKAGIESNFRGDETACTKPFKAPHENLPSGAPVPQNTGFHFKESFTHPGDSHSFSETKDVLALPVIAPWGSTVDAVELALKLKPKHIIPIHDWHYSEAGRKWLYGFLANVFEGSGIRFHGLHPGESVDIA